MSAVMFLHWRVSSINPGPGDEWFWTLTFHTESEARRMLHFMREGARNGTKYRLIRVMGSATLTVEERSRLNRKLAYQRIFYMRDTISI